MSTISHNLPEILERLSALFPADQVKSFPMTTTRSAPWKGMAAFYIDNRAVQQRLDDTCVWKNEYIEDPRSAKSILCGITILVETFPGHFEWISRWDGADNTDIEATKGGLSGSMRRAAVQWGIGRYLYDVPGQWCEMKDPSGSGKPKYFKAEPRMPAKFLPGASRARSVSQSSSPAPAKATTKKAPAKKAAPEKVKLTAAQTSEFKSLTDGLSRTVVKNYYNKIINGKISYEDACDEIAVTIASKPDK